ncbi:hypothetical protein E8E12_001344 [Didymella heteroderae]|uniref:Uncharacterized protein n=1 Tax=Didymella heteroderae TaxID=1769908 RepID=A0A9P4WJR0_9PLEO|nr:hypothetical protein E8E12_001344 [Didymella heteroderae]
MQIIDALQIDFELTDEQIAALPPLDEVELTPQSDSRFIEHAEVKVFTYHLYKLFVGEHNGEPFHAYLTRSGVRKHYKIELCSVDAKNGTHFEPMEAGWFGTVNNLAYPFNTFVGRARFVAVVKWYFLLAFRAGEFDEDPGFSVTTEQAKRIKDLEKKAAELQRELARKRREGQDAFEQQATELQTTSAMLLQPKTKIDDRPQRRIPRKSTVLTPDRDANDESESRRRRQSPDRRTSFSRGLPLQHFQGHAIYPRGGQVSPQYPYLKDARQPRKQSDHREATPSVYEQRKKEGPWQQNTVFAAPLIPPEKGGSEEWKSRLRKEHVEPASKRPARRRRSDRATEADEIDAMDGSAYGNKEDEDVTRMSWTQEVKQLTSTGEDDEKQDELKEEPDLEHGEKKHGCDYIGTESSLHGGCMTSRTR